MTLVNPKTFYKKPDNYSDLEIRLLGLQAEGYPVEITFSGEQEFPRGYLAPDIIPWNPGVFPAKNGEHLFESLFADKSLKTAWANVRGQNPFLRIRLRIDAAAPELHTIPWELLRDKCSHEIPVSLAVDFHTPFSRYLAGQHRHGAPVLRRPIRVLVVLANPVDLEDFKLSKLDLKTEQQTMTEALQDAGNHAEEFQVVFLEQPATLSAIEKELKQGYHILHIIAHGYFDKEEQQAELYLADNQNQVQTVSDLRFAEMLTHAADSLRLIVLASCQSATRSSADALRGFAPVLIASGVPAVIAMQDLVMIKTVRQFTSTFYRQLARHGQVDLAANEARSAVMTAELPGAAIPVLFMRLRSGFLFGKKGEIRGNRETDEFWETLLETIRYGECTPLLGSGVNRSLLPEPDELALALAGDSYPFADRDNLPHVAQFFSTTDRRHPRRNLLRNVTRHFARHIGLKFDAEIERMTLSAMIASCSWTDVCQQLFEDVDNEIHNQLADLNLPLYITTNFDNFMMTALRSKGKDPRQEIIAWQHPHQDYYDFQEEATPEKPVVLHLFGTDQDLFSMVLSEDDYLDYLTHLARDYDYFLPTNVQETLASTTLLFLGYRLGDLDSKLLLRGLLPGLNLDAKELLHVAVQIEAEDLDEATQEKVIRYFRKYFSRSNIDLYWGSTQQFVRELHARWKGDI